VVEHDKVVQLWLIRCDLVPTSRMTHNHSLSSSSEALQVSDSDMSADESAGTPSSTSSFARSGSIGQENRIASLHQANRVLKMELEMYKLRCKQLQEENKVLRKTSVTIQAKAEQEEEFISNTLMKKINTLKREKEILAMNYEQEEECLTNDLSKKLVQLRNEKVELEQTLEREQEFQVNKLIRRIERLENETLSKQQVLEQLRKEKIDLENTLEQEQEALVNRLWIRMEKLEAEKRMLQEKLDQPISEPASPRQRSGENALSADDLSNNVSSLRDEVRKLRGQLEKSQAEYSRNMHKMEQEEHHVKEENVRLRRKLMLEMERREALGRQLSESESSLEMDEERHFNEIAAQGGSIRDRTISSPIPYLAQRPKSPAHVLPASTQSAFTPPSPKNFHVSSSASCSSLRGSSPPRVPKQRSSSSQSSTQSPSQGRKSQRPLSGV